MISGRGHLLTPWIRKHLRRHPNTFNSETLVSSAVVPVGARWRAGAAARLVPARASRFGLAPCVGFCLFGVGLKTRFLPNPGSFSVTVSVCHCQRAFHRVELFPVYISTPYRGPPPAGPSGGAGRAAAPRWRRTAPYAAVHAPGTTRAISSES